MGEWERANFISGSFSFSPSSDELQFVSVTSGFTRLIMKSKFVCLGLISLYVNFRNGSFSFPPPPPPTSHELQFISVTSGLTRLSMKTKYVCRGLFSLYVDFHSNPINWSTNLHVKIRRWGGGGRKKSLRNNRAMWPANLLAKICRWG